MYLYQKDQYTLTVSNILQSIIRNAVRNIQSHLPAWRTQWHHKFCLTSSSKSLEWYTLFGSSFPNFSRKMEACLTNFWYSRLRPLPYHCFLSSKTASVICLTINSCFFTIQPCVDLYISFSQIESFFSSFKKKSHPIVYQATLRYLQFPILI